MEKELNIINFEYQEAKRQTLFFKIIAFVLIFILAFTPLYEFTGFFTESMPHSMCCQPYSCLQHMYLFD